MDIAGEVTSTLPETKGEGIMRKSVTRVVATATIALTGCVSAPVHSEVPAFTASAPPSAVSNALLTPAQKMFGDISPKFAEVTDNVLFGDVWERPGLSKRDRSLVTISALIAMNRPDQLRPHLARARDNGVTEEEIVESITHLAFYSGWPSAVTAITVAKDVFPKARR